MQPTSKPKMWVDPAEAPARSHAADALALFPVSIVALGVPAEPAERLIGLQSGIARFVDLLTSFRTPHFRQPRPAQGTGLPRHIF